MLILAKIASAATCTVALAAVYTFHEGVIKVDVDESRPGGEHIHFFVPATAVSAGMHLAPRHHIEQAAEKAGPYMPLVRQLAKELPKYPNAVFVDVTDEGQHVRVATINGRIQIDVTAPDQNVHVTVPVAVIRDVADNLESAQPGV
jgi:hypothetical protein